MEKQKFKFTVLFCITKFVHMLFWKDYGDWFQVTVHFSRHVSSQIVRNFQRHGLKQHFTLPSVTRPITWACHSSVSQHSLVDQSDLVCDRERGSEFWFCLPNDGGCYILMQIIPQIAPRNRPALLRKSPFGSSIFSRHTLERRIYIFSISRNFMNRTLRDFYKVRTN